MKKLSLVLLLMLAFANVSFATEKIGSVDLVKVMQQYKKSKEANAWVVNQEKSIQKYIIDANKKLQATPEKDRAKLEEKYNKELVKKMETLRKNKEAKVNKLSDDVENAIKQVGESGQYTLIVPSTMALYGSEDLTGVVVKKLNSKK